MPKYEDLINKNYIGTDIDFFKRVLEEAMPANEKLDWSHVDLGDGINYHLIVWFNEDTWPHFHIVSDDNSFNCALSILEPNYYFHKCRFNILQDYQIDKLIEYLNQKPDGYYTRWDCICHFWRDFNEDRMYDYANRFYGFEIDNNIIPDYNILKSNINIKFSKFIYEESV